MYMYVCVSVCVCDYVCIFVGVGLLGWWLGG